MAILSSSQVKPAAVCNFFGVAEGFYWDEKLTYNDQSGDYTHDQRRRLLQFMSFKGLNVYVYAPKAVKVGHVTLTREERAIRVLEGEDLKEWKITFKLAKSLSIDFIWGLTPPKSAPVENLKKVIEVLTYPDNGNASVALLFDDAEGQGHDYDIALQANLVKALDKAFPNKIKAYAPSFYHGVPAQLEEKLKPAHTLIPLAIPFVFSGRNSGCSMQLKMTDFPRFEGRKIVVWDNWIASDDLNYEKNFTSPPLDRDSQIFNETSGYWLNLVFPFERVIPAVSSIAFLKLKKRSPENKGELKELLLKDGGIADDWARELGCSSQLTRAILSIKLGNRDAAINPDIDDIVKTSDLHSLDLLLKNGFDVNAQLNSSKTILQLAVDHANYPLARFLEGRKAHCDGIDWEALKQKWKDQHRRIIDAKFSIENRVKIINSVDDYDLKSLQGFIREGASILIINSRGKNLFEVAQAHGYSDLEKYLQALAIAEEK